MNPELRPKIILVLGMHRSGTSLITQLIAKWGAFMGDDLMPADNYNQAVEAMEAGADIIMLDNIRGEELKKCVQVLKGKVIIEASGNISFENIKDIAETKVDVISTGALIYSAKNIDIGLDF